MLGIFNYIDRIVTQIAKPRKVLFMAIDGVAPRAKLNQQRSRRFASAKDREEARKAAEANGDFVDAASVFDSNCITPGTPFMARVSEHLRYFIRKKQKEDEVWRRLTIVFSGHEVPGEGEHKIMQYIREIRDDPNYDPNTAHCMYGQDADLIMLGLVSHEPHFTLLREVINFNQNRRNRRDPVNVTKTVVKQTARADFQLLHVSILREYLQIELCQDFYNASIPVNLERVIDDFVFMTFLVGNDFLPHLPSLDISEGAFDRLFGVYKEQAFRIVQSEGRPLSEAYLTMHGEVPNLGRLETFLAAIGAMEDTIFQERAKNEAEFAARRRKWDKRDGRASGPSEEELRLADQAKRAEFEAALQDLGQAVPGQQQQNRPQQGVSAAVARASAEFEYTKARYYFEKLGITPEHADVHGAIRQHYLEGLLWCLAYYYRGCVSWGWFYPFHYGPMMSDMVGLTDLGSKIRFEKGAPFLPFEQLLGCLPALSSQFLPKNYQVRSLVAS
jgi:5'-3' exoribonuclease 1